MEQDRLQKQRYELKYIIPEAKAVAIRDFVRCYLDVDEYGAGKPNLSYPVHSLYLDSDQLALYQTTINGDKNRFKLRLRYYTDAADAPVFFEIKRRTNNTISKERGAVKRSLVPDILGGQIPDPSQLLSKSPKSMVAIQRFCHHAMALRARPKAHIAYLREAWIHAEDNSVRVTMDREVRCSPDPTMNLSTQMDRPVMVFGDEVVLELKFTNRFPDWFRELVRVFGLMQCGAAKYVDGVTLLGDARLRELPRMAEHDTSFMTRNPAGSQRSTRRTAAEAARFFA